MPSFEKRLRRTRKKNIENIIKLQGLEWRKSRKKIPLQKKISGVIRYSTNGSVEEAKKKGMTKMRRIYTKSI